MSEIIQESLNKDQPMPVSIECTRTILYQMENCICKIHKDNGAIGTGFFCEIPFKENSIKVLITNNHVLNKNEIENNKIININIRNKEKEEEIKKIKIDNTRKKYTNKELDVTIIEINEDKDNIHNYIEIDNDINNDMNLNKEEIIINYKNIYKNESIYILNYMNGENVSYGLITEINEENGINHKCNTDNGSSGSPILSLKNNKLIGIHYGSPNKYEYNLGTLIIYAIIEFNKIQNNEIQNEIQNENLINGNEITIIYKIDNNDKKIILFGKPFI